MLSIEVVFFFLAVVSLPNLFFRGEYNTAVFFFSCGCWTSQYKTTVVYILLLSWLIDAYSLISYIADSKHGLNIPGREMVFWITFFLFVVKVFFRLDRSLP